jgi:nucleotide-binding universal stress UspA family protein
MAATSGERKAQQESWMTYKTILVHCDSGELAPKRLAIAADLAKIHDAKLVVLHARPPFEMPMLSGDEYSLPMLIEAHNDQVEREETMSHAYFCKTMNGRTVQAEWRALDGRPEDVLTLNARYADLIVVGQSDPENPPSTPGNLPESVAMASGRPTLVVPHDGLAKAIGKNVMLCWNASRESARAASDALPFLKAAQNVIVLVIEPTISPDGHGAEPGADVAMWLAKHGVKVTVQREAAPDADVGKVICSRAADHDIDLIVMGVYGHSRVREWVMGGASRSMLSTMTVPVLMSH